MILNYEFYLSLTAKLRTGLTKVLSQDSKGLSKTTKSHNSREEKIHFECSYKSGINWHSEMGVVWDQNHLSKWLYK